ncbi:unnamed protein product [Discula destructiva]
MHSLTLTLLGLLPLIAGQVTIPEGCESTALSQTWNTFTWFNSSHNLDCAQPNFPTDATYCVNNTDSGTPAVLCDPDAGWPCDRCYQMCSGPWTAGITDQPLGYGPPDYVEINGCGSRNPQFLHRYEVGEGYAGCSAGSALTTEFWGNSTIDEGGNGSYWFSPTISCGSEDGGYYRPVYEATFPLHCVRDAGNNATCTTDLPFEVPLTGFM